MDVFARGIDAAAQFVEPFVIAIGGIEVPSTYRYACTFRPPHLRVTLRYLSRRYDLSFAPKVLEGRYRRFCGDLVAPGKGEILVWADS